MSTRSESRSALSNSLPVAGVLLAVAACWVGYLAVGRGDLSVDEAYTLAEVRLPWPDLLTVIARRELNGSAHTLLVALLPERLTPSPGVGARWLSAAMVVAGITILFEFLRRRFALGAALAGTAIAALSPQVLFGAWNGRTYAMTFLWGGLLLASLPLRSPGDVRQRLYAWALLAAVAAYVHFLLIPVCVVQGLWILALERRRLRLLVGPAVIVCLGWLPVIAFLAAGGDGSQIPDVPAPSWQDRLALVIDFFAEGFSGQRALQALLLVLLAVLSVHTLRPGTGQPRWEGLLGALSILAVLAGTEVAALVHPGMLTVKYLPAASASIGLWVAAALSPGATNRTSSRLGRSGRLVTAGLTAAVIALSVVQAAHWASARSRQILASQSWTQSAAAIREAAGPQDVVTTMVPFEEHAARVVVEAAGTRFAPGRPTTEGAMLAASSYVDRTCFERPPSGGNLWVMSTQSPRLDEAATQAAECVGLRLVDRRQVGFVTLLRFAVNGGKS